MQAAIKAIEDLLSQDLVLDDKNDTAQVSQSEVYVTYQHMCVRRHAVQCAW